MENRRHGVSIVVPCYNEEATIEFLLKAIRDQDYRAGEIEVVIADGMSSDTTRERIRKFSAENPEMIIRMVDNPQRKIPSGLNRAITESRGEYIIRLDAHSIPAPDYVRRCIERLDSGIAENVGGVWKIKSKDSHWVGRSIAAAAAHPIGVGDAFYRYGTKAAYVDTVPFGAFKRSVIEQIGLFNEKLLSNEDYEFNARIRANGGRIWFDPQIQSIYFARGDFPSLIKQYFRYGYWKYQMLRAYPKTLRWRQALPPLFILSLLSLIIASPWLFYAQVLLIAVVMIYFLILFFASIPFVVKHRIPAAALGFPLSIAIMHLSWGSGFLWSMVKSLIRG